MRLEIGSRKWEQPLTVMPDPRVSIGQQDYAAQFALAKGLAEALDASTAKAQEVKSLRAQLKNTGCRAGSGDRGASKRAR